MTDQPQESEKMPLKKDQDLQLWVLEVSPEGMRVMYPRSTEISVAFNVESAMQKVLKKYANHPPFTVKSIGSIPMEMVLKGVDLETRQVQEENSIEISPPPPAQAEKPTVEQFINNLKFFADEFVKNEEHKQQLKDIINEVEQSLPKESKGGRPEKSS